MYINSLAISPGSEKISDPTCRIFILVVFNFRPIVVSNIFQVSLMLPLDSSSFGPKNDFLLNFILELASFLSFLYAHQSLGYLNLACFSCRNPEVTLFVSDFCQCKGHSCFSLFFF